MKKKEKSLEQKLELDTLNEYTYLYEVTYLYKNTYLYKIILLDTTLLLEILHQIKNMNNNNSNYINKRKSK